MTLSFAARFLQGMKAAIPVWIAFVPSSLAWGIAAQDHGLSLEEVILMSAWVYSGPAQFAVLAPLAEGKSALQVLIAGFLMNLRFLPMSAALAPFFRGVKRPALLLASHVISASSFIIPYMQFQKERLPPPVSSPASDRVAMVEEHPDVMLSESEASAFSVTRRKADSSAPPQNDILTQPRSGEGVMRDAAEQAVNGIGNLAFFLGVGATSFLVWVAGTAGGFVAAFGFPPGFEEALKFILPGYFAGLLVVEMKGWTMPLICLASLIAAVPGVVLSPGWGWLATAIAVASLGWGMEEWKLRASK
jgi:predicted branched-subunit amino acid permease